MDPETEALSFALNLEPQEILNRTIESKRAQAPIRSPPRSPIIRRRTRSRSPRRTYNRSRSRSRSRSISRATERRINSERVQPSLDDIIGDEVKRGDESKGDSKDSLNILEQGRYEAEELEEEEDAEWCCLCQADRKSPAIIKLYDVIDEEYGPVSNVMWATKIQNYYNKEIRNHIPRRPEWSLKSILHHLTVQEVRPKILKKMLAKLAYRQLRQLEKEVIEIDPDTRVTKLNKSASKHWLMLADKIRVFM